MKRLLRSPPIAGVSFVTAGTASAGSKKSPLRTAFEPPSFVILISTLPEIVQFM